MTDTYTLAYQACSSYFVATGKMPTVESIKAAIGIKSPTTISTAIKDWKGALAKSMDESRVAITGIPPALKDAFVSVWQQAQTESATTYQERLAQLDAKQALFDTKEKELDADKERMNHLVEITELRYQEEINLLKKETVRLAEESAEFKIEATANLKRATEAEKNSAVYSEQIRQEMEKRKLLEVQYEREHDWSLKRIEEEKDIYRQNTQHEMKRLQGETTRSKQALELIQAKLEQMGNQAKADQERIIGLERSLSDEKVKLASMILNEAKYQNELNAQQEHIRMLMIKPKKSNVSK
jgi:DNA repair exonuclease SbcCD ATPase subunit